MASSRIAGLIAMLLVVPAGPALAASAADVNASIDRLLGGFAGKHGD
jgi:hypothetical protein